MNESKNPATQLTAQQQYELELLHSILGPEATYPWNLSDPAARECLDRLEQQVPADAWSDEAFESKWQAISQVSAQLWDASSVSVATVLARRFSDRIPADLLTRIAEGAKAAAASGQSILDQMVATAQSVMTDWEGDDLRVMARPLAMAMRSEGDHLDRYLSADASVEWEQLSEVQQAQLSLAIAHYALTELSDAK